MKRSSVPKKSYVGGQAIIEGVMMKGRNRIAMAVRKPNGRIAVKTRPYKTAASRFPLKLAFVRGVVFLIEMLFMGVETLEWSANQQMGKEEKLGKGSMALTLVVSFCLALALFLGLPYAAAALLVGNAPQSILFNLVDGVARLIVFLAYIWGIGLWKDVRRLYQYHGAEHATVHCYESGQPLTVANARKFSTVHVRCGTSLLVYVVGISIVVFSLIRVPQWYYNIPLRFVVLPIIGGIGYEILRLSARFPNSLILLLLSYPGRLVQRITTKKPTPKQLEVAIAALKKVV
jgi:uncharacterized protein YqhQ